jgi:drug/metabolite transporter (DMT)-like permease
VSDPPQRAPAAIALMCLAMMLLAGMDAITKHLAPTYAVPQIMAIRYAVFSGVALVLARRTGIRRNLASRHPAVQILRAGLLLAEVAILVTAFRLLPLADVHALLAVAPVIAIVLAALFLGEAVGLKRWLAIGFALAGVLIILRPGFAALSWPMALPLVGALLWAGYQTVVRWLGPRDSAETTVLYTALVGFAVCAGLAPFDWRPPDAADWGWLLGVAVLGSAAHTVLILSIRLAPVAVVQPFAYTIALWATFFGFLVFGHLPDAWTVAGAVMIVAAGVYSMRQQAPGPG